MKQKIVIKGSELKQIVKESVEKVLGIIDHQSARLDEMARVGFINGQLEVYVWTDDAGKIPHVHIRDTNTQGHQFETCVRIDKNDYFLHGHYTDKMNSRQKRDFAMFMQSKPKSTRFDSNYELAVEMWNLNNSDVSVMPQYDANGNIIIPDYEKM